MEQEKKDFYESEELERDLEEIKHEFEELKKCCELKDKIEKLENKG